MSSIMTLRDHVVRKELIVLATCLTVVITACDVYEGAGQDTIGRQWQSDVLACANWPTQAGETRPVRVDHEGVVVLAYGAVDRTQIGIVKIDDDDGRVAWCRAGIFDGEVGEGDSSRYLALVGGRGSDVILLDAATGVEQWRSEIRPPTGFWAGGRGHSASERFAAFVTSSGRWFDVVVLSVATGQVQWMRTDTSDAPFDVKVQGAEVYGDTVLVYGNERLDRNGVSRRGFFYGYAAKDGTSLFRRNSGDSTTNFTARPVRTASGFVFGNNDGLALAIDRAGRVRWSQGGARGVIGPGTTPAVVGDMLYVGSADGSVTALDIVTGAIRWRTPRGFSLQDVAACEPYVFAKQELVLYKFDRRTGRQLAVAGDDTFWRPNPVIGYLASNGVDAYGGGAGRVFRLRCR